jgi:hypothetical protein
MVLILPVLFATTLTVAGCGPAAEAEKASADVAHDHDGDGKADHTAEEHGAE